MGRVTRDPELRYTPKGTGIANLGLAVNRVWTEDGEKRQETTFVDVTLWGRAAEVASQYLRKGGRYLLKVACNWTPGTTNRPDKNAHA
jgi:single-strand DNA-binding protein